MKQKRTKKGQKRTRFFTVNIVTIQRHILDIGKDILRRRNIKKLEMKQNETNETKNAQTRTKRTEKQKICNHTCDICNESFGSRTTLWRHKKKCVKASSKKDSSNDALNIILQENKALREQLLKEAKENKEFLHQQLSKANDISLELAKGNK